MTTAQPLCFRALLLLLPLLLLPMSAMAIDCIKVDQHSATAVDPTAFSHQFDSGARWDLCWQIDEQAGLTLSNIHYGAPAEASVKLMERASLAQILFKYDEDISTEHILSTSGLGGSNHVPANSVNCPAGNRHVTTDDSGICTRLRDLNTMTSVRRSVALRRHELSLHAFSKVGAKMVEQVWRFSEDGQITPAVRISGELDRFTNKTQYGTSISETGPLAANASLLFTWRLDFNIGDTPNNDIVEQVEFVPHISNVVRRTITTTPLNSESFNKVHRTQFRGWLVRDADLSAGSTGATRMGYYLDPQSSGFDFVSRHNNWALFDLSVTRSQPCEKLASKNTLSQPNCADSLDQFINGESLINQNPVIWFSLARQLLPKSEDYPAMTTREVSFKLIPFDWSASTPFTPLTP